jgi:carboxypeptidase T
VILLLFIVSIDPRYHTFDEVAYELDSIATYFPSITHLDTIGYSTCDSLPIFAVKISDSADIEEDEPAVLYIGCHHAEEILGIEICMYMINDLIDNYTLDSTKTHWVNNQEIWFVPILNPEGHSIVMNGIDTTWRKNKRDNNNNGIFDLDYDGVDLNRNYDFYWSEGGSSDPSSEYYRGPEPFSENETRVIRDLCLEQYFVFCNTYHSARTGLGEVVYYPYRWSGGYSPDYPFIREIADSISKRIINDQGNSHYTALPGVGLDGRARNWLYGVCGIFTYCIEVSQTTIQPGWMVDDICERNLAGAYYLLERVAGSSITGCVYDSITGEPLSAEVIIEGYYDPELPPRQSEPQFGRFRRILAPGSYNIEVHHPDYVSKYYESIAVEQGTPTELNVYLRDKDYAAVFAHPNPGRDIVYIQLINPLHITRLKIYDILGRLLRTFDNPTSVVTWNCRDTQNREIPNGIYFIVGETTDENVCQKVIVLH